MSSLHHTKTYQNLQTAYMMKSEISSQYAYYAEQAKKEGYEQISGWFSLLAAQEREHAKVWYKLLYDGMGSTKENVERALEIETEISDCQYVAFAEQAQDEGFDQIASLYEKIAQISKNRIRNLSLLKQAIETQNIFEQEQSVLWICRNCGYIQVGVQAPMQCPVCTKPQAYFQLASDEV